MIVHVLKLNFTLYNAISETFENDLNENNKNDLTTLTINTNTNVQKYNNNYYYINVHIHTVHVQYIINYCSCNNYNSIKSISNMQCGVCIFE